MLQHYYYQNLMELKFLFGFQLKEKMHGLMVKMKNFLLTLIVIDKEFVCRGKNKKIKIGCLPCKFIKIKAHRGTHIDSDKL